MPSPLAIGDDDLLEGDKIAGDKGVTRGGEVTVGVACWKGKDATGVVATLLVLIRRLNLEARIRAPYVYRYTV